MRIITLTTDWGQSSHYAGVVKGTILSYNPQVNIVDISHAITQYSVPNAAYVLKHAYYAFPKGTIHVLDVVSESSIETPHILVEYDGHYFIGADNGAFSLICGNDAVKIVEIEILQDSNYYTFAGRDMFAKVAAQLAQGIEMSTFGTEQDGFTTVLINTEPVYDPDSIQGSVMFVDDYHNLITNISEKKFKEIGRGRPFVCKFGGKVQKKMLKAYSDQIEGELLLLFNSYGMLEIAQAFGNASSLVDIRVNDRVRIDFND